MESNLRLICCIAGLMTKFHVLLKIELSVLISRWRLIFGNEKHLRCHGVSDIIWGIEICPSTKVLTILESFNFATTQQTRSIKDYGKTHSEGIDERNTAENPAYRVKVSIEHHTCVGSAL